MYYAKDREKAELALADLRNARLSERAAAAACLQRLRNEIACEWPGDLPRMQAWMSIRKLYDAFKAKPERDLKPLWQDAIARIVAWSESLR